LYARIPAGRGGGGDIIAAELVWRLALIVVESKANRQTRRQAGTRARKMSDAAASLQRTDHPPVVLAQDEAPFLI
jgi:hypothetical protein